jgi:hypothetical protein
MHLGGVIANPAGEWTVQQARNLAISLDERFADFTFLICDRGSNFTAAFDAVFAAPVSAVQAPRMNAICERLVGTRRREVLDRMLILGAAHLGAVLAEYQAHYNAVRPHQGVAQHVPDADQRRGVPRVPYCFRGARPGRRAGVLPGGDGHRRGGAARTRPVALGITPAITARSCVTPTGTTSRPCATPPGSAHLARAPLVRNCGLPGR